MRRCLSLFLAQSNVTDGVLEAVAYEAHRLFRDRLVSSRDLHNFDNILSSIIRGEWGSDVLDNMSGILFSHLFKSQILFLQTKKGWVAYYNKQKLSLLI